MDTAIGLDLGTTTCKAVALSSSGEILATSSSGYPLVSPRPGWVEQDALRVWGGVIEALAALVADLPDHRFTALSLSGAMHSLLPVGLDGSPLARAMTWADNRTADLLPELRRQIDPHELYLQTGCPLQPTYHIARLQWWMREGIASDTRFSCFAGIKDWILYRLTGSWATDHSLASATGLLDIRRLIWHGEALNVAGIEAGHLPPLVSPESVVGSLSGDVAERTGLPEGLPVVAGASDGGLANLGSAVDRPGQITVTVGTSGAVRKIVAAPQLDPQERTWCYVLLEGQWFTGGAINNGGLAIEWIRKRLYPATTEQEGYQQLFQEANTIPPGAEGLLLLPYFAGSRSPHWTPESRGVLHGLGLEHSRAHIARAALEGVAFCLAEVWEALVEETPPTPPTFLTGGITNSQLWSQIVADVLGVPLTPVEVADASAVGAALLGHRVIGHIPDLAALAGRVPLGDPIHPNGERHKLYQEQRRAFSSLYQKLWT